MLVKINTQVKFCHINFVALDRRLCHNDFVVLDRGMYISGVGLGDVHISSIQMASDVRGEHFHVLKYR